MTEGREDLQQSLKDYENQLSVISDAISQSTEPCEDLVSLKNNIIELIALTKETLDQLTETKNDDPLAQEYELFKAELLDNDNDNNNIEEELSQIIGNKCQAPFKEQWSSGLQTYHNALITSLDPDDTLDNIKVKVMFINPTCKEMVPCKYYLDGECRFDDDKCHFSHGYVVHFSELKEYIEPNFSLLQENAAVLAKDTDDIWKRAIVTAVILEQSQCSVKFESGHKLESIIDFHYILPLGHRESVVEDCPSTAAGTVCISENDRAALIEKSLLQEPPSSKLGEWEKFTSGIGSKLMAKMGYIIGTGLGKNSEGRVEPVAAVALPPGKSLDHCMALREKAGGDPNLFKVDRLQKKLQRQIRNRKSVPGVPTKKPQNVFSFMNDMLSGDSKSKGREGSSQSESVSLKRLTSRALNIRELKLDESMQKKQYELYVLRDKLSRQKQNTVEHTTLLKKVKFVENEVKNMQSGLKNIQREQSYRQSMKELTEF